MSDLHYLSATDALNGFRSGELSPVELMQATIDRIEAVEGTINALPHRFFDEAMDAARSAEARYQGKGDPPRPLEGIPTAVKEEEEIAGQPWTQGSLIYKDEVGQETSVFAERIIDSGAIVHARSTAPEFSCAGFTQSRLWGVTRNPWNPAVGVGGSSGGSGAALAAGTATLASGSDIGGSIRIPASFNGVVGFKPPHGRVPQAVPFNLDMYCHCGPMARTVMDTLLFENVLVGPDPRDIASLRPRLELPTSIPDIRGLRIAVCPDLGAIPLDPEVRCNTLELAFALREEGAIVEEVEIKLDADQIRRAYSIHFNQSFGPYIASYEREHGDLMTRYALGFRDLLANDSADGTVGEQHWLESQLYLPIGDVLSRYDALLCASVGMRGLDADDDYTDHGIEVGGVQLDHYFQGMLCVVFNMFSRCPVLNVPSGFADNGVPTGVQIVGPTYDDLVTFRVGAACERVRPWLDTPERRPVIA